MFITQTIEYIVGKIWNVVFVQLKFYVPIFQWEIMMFDKYSFCWLVCLWELLFIMFPLIKIFFFLSMHLFKIVCKESLLTVIGVAWEQIINLECCSAVLPNSNHVPVSGEGKKKWRTMKEICISFITGTDFSSAHLWIPGETLRVISPWLHTKNSVVETQKSYYEISFQIYTLWIAHSAGLKKNESVFLYYCSVFPNLKLVWNCKLHS